MLENTTSIIASGQKEAAGLEDAARKLPLPKSLEQYYTDHPELKDIPLPVIKKAWFTMAHVLVEPGSTIVDMGCYDGAMTYAMATMHPELTFIGIDKKGKTVKDAKKKYKRDNLTFQTGDISNSGGIEDESVDAIINSFILYEIFSEAKYNDRAVISALTQHFKLLKPDGVMFIRDYAMPPPGEYVMLEMPDIDSEDKDLKNMSEPDLLVWYSENARPGGEPGCNGFFLEELPERFPKTRLFRLPYKWAYEFMMRKDDRNNWAQDLPKEYTFFTQREYRKNLRLMGARVLYTAPHWDDAMVREKFEGHFRLYDDNGKSLGAPPTSFIAVAQKRAEKESLCLHERRPSAATDGLIRVTSMRDETSGKLIDIVSRDIDLTEVIPYRVTGEGKLNVFIHDGVPRALSNAIPRTGKEIDGKRWSGHMTEAIAVPTNIIAELQNAEYKQIVKFANDYLGLKAGLGNDIEEGPSYYPAPDRIDELIRTRYLYVPEQSSQSQPRRITKDIDGFTTNGIVREMDAQSLLNAINVGLIPNSRLELQIQFLMDRLNIETEDWNNNPLVLTEKELKNNIFDSTKLAKQVMEDDKRYKDIRGTSGQIRTVRSTFIDEGWVEGGMTGLAAKNMEFVISNEETINKACVIPLCRDLENKLHAGFVTEYMPIPQRHKGNGMTITAPSFNMPKHIQNMTDAKKYVAELFEVSVDNVWRLGESYFEHIGITPQRIFPFAVNSDKDTDPITGGPIQYAPMEWIWNIIWAVQWDWSASVNFIWAARKASRYAGPDSDMGVKFDLSRAMVKQTHAPKILNTSSVSGVETMNTPAPGSNGPSLKNLKIYDKNGDRAWRPGEADYMDSQHTQEKYVRTNKKARTPDKTQDAKQQLNKDEQSS